MLQPVHVYPIPAHLPCGLAIFGLRTHGGDTNPFYLIGQHYPSVAVPTEVERLHHAREGPSPCLRFGVKMQSSGLFAPNMRTSK